MHISQTEEQKEPILTEFESLLLQMVSNMEG